MVILEAMEEEEDKNGIGSFGCLRTKASAFTYGWQMSILSFSRLDQSLAGINATITFPTLSLVAVFISSV